MSGNPCKKSSNDAPARGVLLVDGHGEQVDPVQRAQRAGDQVALAGFAFLLAVTWSFRGTAQKYARPDLEGERHDATATGPANPGTGPTTADEDSPHWPEHPGHQH